VLFLKRTIDDSSELLSLLIGVSREVFGLRLKFLVEIFGLSLDRIYFCSQRLERVPQVFFGDGHGWDIEGL